MKILVWDAQAGVVEGVFEAPSAREALRLAHEEAQDEGRCDFHDRYAVVYELAPDAPEYPVRHEDFEAHIVRELPV